MRHLIVLLCVLALFLGCITSHKNNDGTGTIVMFIDGDRSPDVDVLKIGAYLHLDEKYPNVTITGIDLEVYKKYDGVVIEGGFLIKGTFYYSDEKKVNRIDGR